MMWYICSLFAIYFVKLKINIVIAILAHLAQDSCYFFLMA